MNSKQHIIFDLDDTLIDTSHVFWMARSKFCELFDQNIISNSEIVEIFENIDNKNINIYGFSPNRYGYSMRESYEYICKLYKLNSNIHVERFIETLALIVPNTMPELIDGASDLVKWCSEHFSLSLLTRGVYEFQIKKLRYAGLESYFEKIEVVDKKNSDAFQNHLISLNQQAKHCWVVGDSIKSDINPAISLGINPILYFYSHHTYIWLHEYDAEAEGSFYLAKSLPEVKQFLSNPDSFKKIVSLARSHKGDYQE